MQQLTTPFAHASQVKLTLSFYQVATLIPEVYIVQMPAQVHGVLEFFSLADRCVESSHELLSVAASNPRHDSVD